MILGSAVRPRATTWLPGGASDEHMIARGRMSSSDRSRSASPARRCTGLVTVLALALTSLGAPTALAAEPVIACFADWGAVEPEFAGTVGGSVSVAASALVQSGVSTAAVGGSPEAMAQGGSDGASEDGVPSGDTTRSIPLGNGAGLSGGDPTDATTRTPSTGTTTATTGTPTSTTGTPPTPITGTPITDTPTTGTPTTPTTGTPITGTPTTPITGTPTTSTTGTSSDGTSANSTPSSVGADSELATIMVETTPTGEGPTDCQWVESSDGVFICVPDEAPVPAVVEDCQWVPLADGVFACWSVGPEPDDCQWVASADGVFACSSEAVSAVAVEGEGCQWESSADGVFACLSNEVSEAAVAAVSPVVALAPRATVADPRDVVLEHQAVNPDESQSATGAGWTPDESVAVDLESTTRVAHIGDVTVGTDGGYQVAFLIPNDFPLGPATLRLTGSRSGTYPVALTIGAKPLVTSGGRAITPAPWGLAGMAVAALAPACLHPLRRRARCASTSHDSVPVV